MMEQKGIKGFFKRLLGQNSTVANDGAATEKPIREVAEKTAIFSISEDGWAFLTETSAHAGDLKVFLHEAHNPETENRFTDAGHALTECLKAGDAVGAKKCALRLLDEYAGELRRELEEKDFLDMLDWSSADRHKSDVYFSIVTDEFARITNDIIQMEISGHEGIATDESRWLAELDLNLDHIDISLDRVEKEFGCDYLADLFEHSPYKEAQREAVEMGDLDADERLSAETSGWAVDVLIYKTRPAVHGLLSEAAKDCLKSDLMIPAAIVNIFDDSREGYTQAAENFNRAVEVGSSDDILCSFHSLFLHAESYEFEKMERKGISFDKISEKLIARYGEDFGSGYETYREEIRPCKAPMLADQPDISPVKIREAPMLSQADAAPKQPDSPSLSPGI